MRKNKWKGRLATVLAAAMVCSMVAPPKAAYAANYGDPSVIRFDPSQGPDLSKSTYKNAPMDAGKITSITGQAGYLLSASSNVAGIPTETIGSGSRPKLPEFDNASTIWPGYQFDGWYDSQDNKISNLPYAFPYNTPTTYKAKWIGDTVKEFPFTVMHYRDLDEVRNANTDGTDLAVWPGAGDTNIIKFFDNGDWTKQVSADTPISAGYKRNIPGYSMETAIIKNNFVRRYNEAAGAGTLSKAAEISTTNNTVKGNMPNDDLTVAYRYKPDTTKTFSLRAEYVDTNGSAILAPTVSNHSVEADISLSPKPITAYTLESATIKSGFGDVDDLSGKGVYSATSAGCTFDSNHNFTGKMPNQPVIVTYQYKIDPDFTTEVVVNTVDNHGKIMKPQQTMEVKPADPIELSVPRVSGYVYPPNIAATGSISNLSMDQANAKLTFNVGISAGTVKITYLENLSDSTYWGRIEYVHGRNGSLTGDTGVKTVKLGTHTVEDLTAQAVPSPETNYIFDGWYKANAAGTDKTGSKLTGNVTLTENIKLYANFAEDPNNWFDLTFQAGSYGTITGNKKLHVVTGSAWSSLAIPTPEPNEAKYMFDGWYDEKGHKIDPTTMQILASQTYTARFKLVSGNEDGIFAMPDTEGIIGTDGKGQISISGGAEARKYVLTDAEGTILAIMTGLETKSKKFTDLVPCSSYLVYEVSDQTTPVAGQNIEACVDPAQMSQPTMTVVPALGNNYKAVYETDKTVTLTVKPAAPGVSYGVLDETGNFVGEWVQATGNPLSAQIKGLNPGTNYTVVGKATSTSPDAADLILKGSQVTTPFADAEESKDLTFQIVNGGYVEEITRDGQALTIESGQTSFTLRAGDQIKVNAEVNNSDGDTFKQWEILFGSLNIQYPDRRNQTITMPSDNLMLQAYYVDENSPYKDVTVNYSPKNVGFALKTEGTEGERLKADLTDNTLDAAALAANQALEYTVKFTKRVPVASESNAVRAEMEETEGLVSCWTVSTSMARKLEGITKPIPDDGNQTPDIQIYAQVDKGFMKNIEFQLWSVSEGPDGEYVAAPVPMTPDPNDPDSGFAGIFSFDAKVGDTMMLTSFKAHQVTVTDSKRGTTDKLQVKDGMSLEDSDGYADLTYQEDYIEPTSQQVWINLGLSKTVDGKVLYDITKPVTEDLQLYAVFEKQENKEWLAAEKALKELIDIAHALSGNALVEEADQELLKEGVKAATDLLNSLPRPSLSELTDAYKTLKDLVDQVKENNQIEEPETEEWKAAKKLLDDALKSAEALRKKSNLTGEDQAALDDAIQETRDLLATIPRPSIEDMTANTDYLNQLVEEIKSHYSGGTGGGTGGGGSSSGSGVGGSGREKVNGYQTYVSGLDGSWSNVDGGIGWSFTLSDGTVLRSRWINVAQSVNGVNEILTFHINADGKADHGWLQDFDGTWYYLSPSNDGKFGHMVKGWHLSQQDGRWYYLSDLTGAMMTGWQKVNGAWYYLSTGNDGRPQGSLYVNETTPDGYQVNQNGVRIKDMPE